MATAGIGTSSLGLGSFVDKAIGNRSRTAARAMPLSSIGLAFVIGAGGLFLAGACCATYRISNRKMRACLSMS
jgi:hypothetical protein